MCFKFIWIFAEYYLSNSMLDAGDKVVSKSEFLEIHNPAEWADYTQS